MSKFDRFLVSAERDEVYPNSKGETFPYTTSDHIPILLNRNNLLSGPRLFKFENMWLKHLGFVEMVREWCSQF